MSTGADALSITGLQYGYRHPWTYRFIPLLKSFSLNVTSGESFGFLGHNGAGKTTAIKCILGLVKPTAGEVRIFGEPSGTPQGRRHVGFVPEQPYFYDYLTVSELLNMYAALAGVPRDERAAHVRTALERVKISARSKSAMRSLSKGLTQRVALAQAIVGRPRLLILDEPFSGMDPIGRREFRDLFTELKREGTTIFISSHILSDVEFLCDRVSILAHGELRGVFSIGDIPRYAGGRYELTLRDPGAAGTELSGMADKAVAEERALRLQFTSRENAERALARSVELGVPIESFQFLQGSLEDLFVKLVSFEEGGRG